MARSQTTSEIVSGVSEETRTPAPQVPIQLSPQLRRVVTEILEHADELEARANALKWKSESWGTPHSPKIQGLQSKAADLREIAMRVLRAHVAPV